MDDDHFFCFYEAEDISYNFKRNYKSNKIVFPQQTIIRYFFKGNQLIKKFKNAIKNVPSRMPTILFGGEGVLVLSSSASYFY